MRSSWGRLRLRGPALRALDPDRGLTPEEITNENLAAASGIAGGLAVAGAVTATRWGHPVVGLIVGAALVVVATNIALYLGRRLGRSGK